MPCEVCGHPVSNENVRELHGKRVCEPCGAGRYGFRLDPLGIKVQAMTWLERSGARQFTRAEARAVVPYPIEVEAVLDREEVSATAANVSRKDVQVGSREFDDAICIRTKTADATRELLQDPDLQQAILRATEDLARVGGGPPLELAGNAVVVDAYTQDVNGLRRVAVFVARALVRAAVRAGMKRDPALIRLPDVTTARRDGTCPESLVFNQTELADLGPLALFATGWGHLERLHLLECRVLEPDLTPVAALERLNVLNFELVREIEHLGPISSMTRLKRLAITGSRVQDLSPIAGLGKLQELFITESMVSDLTPLAGLQNLRELYMRDVPVTSLEPLRGLRELVVLNIRNTPVEDLGPLRELPALTKVLLGGSRVTPREIDRLKSGFAHRLEIDTEVVQGTAPELP